MSKAILENLDWVNPYWHRQKLRDKKEQVWWRFIFRLPGELYLGEFLQMWTRKERWELGKWNVFDLEEIRIKKCKSAGSWKDQRVGKFVFL